MTGANGLTDLVMSAEYLKRGGRYDAEDKLAKRWEGEEIQRPDSPDEDALDRHELLKSSSHDHAFMHQCKIIEARSGIDAGAPEPRRRRCKRGRR